MTRLPFAAIVVAAALTAACARPEQQPSQPAASQPAAASLPQIRPEPILERIKVLASDEFEGRAPGTAGEERTVAYLVDEFKKLGLQPGNTDGTYIQKVPLVGIQAKNSQPFTVAKGAQKQTFRWADDVVAWTKHVADGAAIRDSEMVFAATASRHPSSTGTTSRTPT